MKPLNRKRDRGVLLSALGWKKLQTARYAAEVRDNFGDRYTLEELSDRTKLDISTVARVLERVSSVDKRTLERFFLAFGLELDRGDYSKPDLNPKVTEEVSSSQPIAKSTVVVGSGFYGRTQELETVKHWVIGDRCRLVVLLGMGGIGKTALAAKLVDLAKHDFDFIVWRSLLQAPSVQDTISYLNQSLGGRESLSDDLNDQISQLIRYLQQHRCLIVLDNAETILSSREGKRAGHYRAGYEGYGELLRFLSTVSHQSCLVLTSREQLVEIALMAVETQRVRSVQLKGLNIEAVPAIFEAKGLSPTLEQLSKLIEHYSGNPLALKLAAATIVDVFDGNVEEFLKQEITVFGDIYELLDQHFHRLSDGERSVMYWLAINREPVSLSELRDDILLPNTHRKLIEWLESLARRMLIEKKAGLFTLQPVVIEYITDGLIQAACQEIATGEITLLTTHALMKATAADDVRDMQVRLIVKPVVEQLLNQLGQDRLEERLAEILQQQRVNTPRQPGYQGGNILNLLCQLTTELHRYDFSSISVWQADGRSVSLHHCNFQNADLVKSVFTEDIGDILAVAVTEGLLAAGDTNGTIRLWQIGNGQQQLTFHGHTGWVRSLAFSPDGQTLVSSSTDQSVRIWDVLTGRCLKILLEHTDRVRTVAFSPDGKLIASGSDDLTIKLCDVVTGQVLRTLTGHTHRVRAVAFHPNGQILASGSDDRTIKLWDTGTGECLKTFNGHQDSVWSVAWSNDGLIASGSTDATVKIWQPETGEILATFDGHRETVASVTFSPDCQFLASASHDRTIKLWELSTGQVTRTLQGHTNWVQSIVFDSKGELLVSGSGDRTVRLWDVATGKMKRTIRGYSNGIWSIVVSPDGQKLVSASDDQTIRLWNISTGQIERVFHGHNNSIWSVALSCDGHLLASASDDQTVRLWDISTGLLKHVLQGHTAGVWSVAFSPVDSLLASGGVDQTVRLWNVNTGQALSVLAGHSGVVRSVAFSPDGQWLASGGTDCTVRLWQINTCECLTLLQHPSPVSSVSFSPDGQMLATGGDDGIVRIWHLNTSSCICQLKGHTDWILSVVFSPDGKVLASAGYDAIRLWDVRTGQALTSLQGHSSWIWSVAFAPTNTAMCQYLASGSQDETIKLWDIFTGECLKTLTIPRPYEAMNITGATGITEQQKATLKALGAVELSNSPAATNLVYFKPLNTKHGKNLSSG